MTDAAHSLLLVEDDAMVTAWVRMSLKGSEIRVAGMSASAAEGLELAQRRCADVMLVDFRLPDGRGTQLVRDLRRSGVTVPAVLMTANEERGFNEAARDAGAQGTLLKTGNTDELLDTLLRVLAGEPAFDERHPRGRAGRGALSPREREVLRLVAGGSTNNEIAKTLGVGGETIKTLLARTFAKLGVRRRAEAVAAAHKRGLL